jgi:DNA primase
MSQPCRKFFATRFYRFKGVLGTFSSLLSQCRKSFSVFGQGGLRMSFPTDILDVLRDLGCNPIKKASTHGGEWGSSCPFCNEGKDRLRVWPQEKTGILPGRFWCRQCGHKGDTALLLMEFRQVTFPEIALVAGRATHGMHTGFQSRHHQGWKPQERSPPSPEWQDYVLNSLIVPGRERRLQDVEMWDHLSKRGFSEPSVHWHDLVYVTHPIQGGPTQETKNFWCPGRSIVIPYYRDGQLYGVRARKLDHLDTGSPKYLTLPDSKTIPFICSEKHWPESADDHSKKTLLILESEFDAMLVHQEASDLCTPVGMAGVSNRPDLRLDQLLKTADHILLAFDYEDDVRRHILWWQQHYPQVTVWFAPECKSIGDAFKMGCDIREWVLRGVLESTEPTRLSC